jgi:hypothetical protein
MDQFSDTGRSGLGGERRLFAARLITGLLQGLALYALYFAGEHGLWPRTQPAAFGALALAAGYAPVVVLAGVGRLSGRTLTIWTAVAAVVLALLGWHDVDRRVLESWTQPPFLSLPTLAFAAAALFIAHHLIAPAVRAGRPIAPYADYFDVAWKAGVQLALSLAFTGAFWLLLHLGGALFRVIGIDALERLLSQAWFAIPLLCLAFATAVQLTDVRDGLIRGVRTVALMLLSWLLPVIAVLVAGFLLALPFTGLDGLWGTRSATALVLSAAAALIILINTAYQDGRPDNLPPRALRVGARIASVLAAPLVGLAFWGLMLRIGQHGLTPDRIIALACAAVGAVYAVGYLIAAVRRGPWLRPLERTNVIAAVLSVAVILALFSPLLDPARLSVANQTARLERGAVAAADFDFDFLRFDSGKAGRAALDRLARSGEPEVARLAQAAKQRDARAFDTPAELRRRAQGVRIAPVAGQTMPEGFAAQTEALPDVLTFCSGAQPCVLRRLDLDGDGREEALVAAQRMVLAFGQREDGRWRALGRYGPGCVEPRDRLRDALGGDVASAPAALPDLIVGGRRLQAQPEVDCGAG